mmetsp:Transcript_14053/g.48403  ORF Transcript_14053/g.48403 Transcript_14053/m.48403 type:complete len:823 (-) Transcript_14053:148-2616(-)
MAGDEASKAAAEGGDAGLGPDSEALLAAEEGGAAPTGIGADGFDLSRKPLVQSNYEGGQRDIFFLLLFVLHFLVLIVLGVLGVLDGGLDHKSSEDTEWHYSWWFDAVPMLLVGLLVASLISCAVIQLSLSNGAAVTQFLLIGAIIVPGFSAGVFVVRGFFELAGPCILLMVSALWYYHTVRHTFHYVKVVFDVVTAACGDQPALLNVTYTLLAVQVFWQATVNFIAIVCMRVNVFTVFYAGFSFLWGSQFIKGMLQLTVSGTIGRWYYMNHDAPKNSVSLAFGLATAKLLGSAAFAGLMVPFAGVVHFVAIKITDLVYKYKFIKRMCCAIDLIVMLSEHLMNQCNRYAYVTVALYGTPLVRSSRRAWVTIKKEGYKEIITCDAVDGSVSFGSMLCGVTCCSLLGVWADRHFNNDPTLSNHDAMLRTINIAIQAFLIGYGVFGTAASIISASVNTIFFCTMACPEALVCFEPELAKELARAYKQCWGSALWYNEVAFYLPPAGAFKPKTRKEGKRRALVVGCNEFTAGAPFPMPGVKNDVAKVMNMLTMDYGIPEKCIRVLSSEQGPRRRPTSTNIRLGLAWLMGGAVEGDQRFFYFSGAGTHIPDECGEEPDGRREAIRLEDTRPTGVGAVNDDELRESLYEALPEGVELLALFDATHHGALGDAAMLELPGVERVPRPRRRVLRPGLGDRGTRFSPPPSQAVLDFEELARQFGEDPKPGLLGARTSHAMARGKSRVVQVNACAHHQMAREASVDGTDTGLLTWAWVAAVRKLGVSATLPGLVSAVQGLLEEAGHDQNIEVRVSTAVKDDPEKPLLARPKTK